MNYLLVSIIKVLIIAPLLLATLACIVCFAGPHGLPQPIAVAVKLPSKAFTAGTLTRYSKILNEVMEAPGGLYR